MRHIFALIGVLALTACLRIEKPAESSGSEADEPALGAQIYVHPENGYSLVHSADWKVRENDALITPEYELTGTAFVYPENRYAGSDLLGAKVHVAVEPQCPPQTNRQEATVNGAAFDTARWSGAAAGSRYEGEVYMTEQGGKCAVFTLFTHWCNLGPDCGRSHDDPFDRTELDDTFIGMVYGFQWQ